MTLFYLCASLLAGIALAPLAGLPLISALAAGILLFLFAFTFQKFRIPFLCLAFLLFGSARLAAARPAPGPKFLGSYVNQTAALDVELEEDPVPQGRGLSVRARVDRIILPEGESKTLDGSLLVEFREPPDGWDPHYGDRVRLSGLLQPPPIVTGFRLCRLSCSARRICRAEGSGGAIDRRHEAEVHSWKRSMPSGAKRWKFSGGFSPNRRARCCREFCWGTTVPFRKICSWRLRKPEPPTSWRSRGSTSRSCRPCSLPSPGACHARSRAG